MKEGVRNASGPSQAPKKSFAQYLIESDIKLLVFVGKSMRYFGTRAVIGFFLGVLAAYGYAAFRPVPFLKPPSEIKRILLHGTVTALEGKPLKAFEIGVLDSRVGPFGREDGSFEVEVPIKKKHSIIVWTPGSKNWNLYADQPIEEEDGRYSLSSCLRDFPISLGIVQGTVMDQDQYPIKGYVEVESEGESRISKIESKGTFRVKDIPLGKAKIRVLETVNGPVLYEKDNIKLLLTDPTLMNLTVKTKEERRD